MSGAIEITDREFSLSFENGFGIKIMASPIPKWLRGENEDESAKMMSIQIFEGTPDYIIDPTIIGEFWGNYPYGEVTQACESVDEVASYISKVQSIEKGTESFREIEFEHIEYTEE